MVRLDITVDYKARLGVFDLRIKDELVGADLSFSLDRRKVWVRLPGDRTRKDYLRSPDLKPSDSGSGEVPDSWQTLWVSILVESGAALSVGADELPHPDESDEVQSAKRLRLNNSHVSKAGVVGENFIMSAYEAWLLAIRRIKMNGRIGRVPREPLMGGTHMVDSFNGREVYATGRTVFAGDMRSSVAVTVENWRAVESLLMSGGAPVYFDLLFDAEQHFELRDLDRAVIDLAMASEVFMKTRIRSTWPAGLSKSAQDILARAQMYQQVPMFEETLSAGSIEETDFKALRGTLKPISDARNRVVHTGRNPDLTDHQVYEWLKIVRRLITLGEATTNEYFPMNARFSGGYLP